MGEAINLAEYIDIIKRRKLVIISIILLFMIGGGFLQYKQKQSYIPTYTSTVSVKININKETKKDSKSSSKSSSKKSKSEEEYNPYSSPSSLESSNLNQSIAEKYSSLAVSKRAIMELIGNLRLKMSYEALRSSINVLPQESIPEFIDITVKNANPETARKIANEMPIVFNNEIKRVIGLDCVEVIYDASEPYVNTPEKTNTFRNFTLIGIALAIFVVLLLEVLNNKVITPDDAEKYWGLPVIGVIPYEKENTKGKKDKKTSIQKD